MPSIKKFFLEYKSILFLFIFWRLTLLLVGLFSFSFLTFKASFPYIDEALIASGLPQFIWHWGNFDGVHYLTVAQHGYHGLINNEQVFFPFYPVLINLITLIIHNFLLSGLIISNLSILLAAIILNKMAKSIWPVIFLFSFPTAFFFGAVYTEALFLLLVLLAFSKNKLFGIFAGLTRLTGFFTGIFGFLGVATYMTYLKLEYDNPLLFLFNQGGFQNARASSLTSLVTPPQVIFRYLKILLLSSSQNIAYWISLLEVSAFLFGIIILAWLTVKRKIPLSWLIFSWLALMVPSFSGTFSSLPRYLLTIFPIFIGLGLLKSKSLKLVITLFFVILQVVLTVLFVRGYFVA